MELEIAIRAGALVLTLLVGIGFLEFENLAYTISNFAAVFGLLLAFGAWIAVLGEAINPRGGVEMSQLIAVATSATIVGGIGYIAVKVMRKFGL